MSLGKWKVFRKAKKIIRRYIKKPADCPHILYTGFIFI